MSDIRFVFKYGYIIIYNHVLRCVTRIDIFKTVIILDTPQTHVYLINKAD